MRACPTAMAFVSGVGVPAAERSRRPTGSLVHSRPSWGWRAVKTVRAPQQVRFVAQLSKPDGAGASEINFSKLDFTEGNEMSGMVFKPEPTTAAVDASGSRARLQFSAACEEAVNNQINVEFTASYTYYALFAFFDRDTVGLPGFAKFFQKQAVEERDHAEALIRYQNKRGGRVHLKPVAVPAMHFSTEDNADALYSMELALQLERFVQEKLMEVWRVADREGDAQMCDFVEEFLTQQVDSIKEISDYVAQLKRVGTGHGVYHFDRELAEKA
ncbi:hypothetical protein CDCA_CDCA11G3146 [Cyanidium caldarium]|uniref:Ferritin n=1 Tax=Cyanidium caldarium TaxID=2771 RepID=A0AAV9IYB5_CYACA|nr:hypothetical protein CDCA_CDCA11G3146 [Cyanidium caldarium]|eukprot:ctg_1829.g393